MQVMCRNVQLAERYIFTIDVLAHAVAHLPSVEIDRDGPTHVSRRGSTTFARQRSPRPLDNIQLLISYAVRISAAQYFSRI